MPMFWASCLYVLTLAALVESAEIPPQAALARSPWPVCHGNGYAQASTALAGPRGGEPLAVQTVATTATGASPWTILIGPYADGSMVAWGATITHVFKIRFHGADMSLVDKVQIDRDWLDFHWNLLALAGDRIVVPDPKERRLLFFADAVPGDPASPIAAQGEIAVDPGAPGRPGLLNVAADGHLITFSTAGGLSAISPDRTRTVAFPIAAQPGEQLGHNQFPVGPHGDLYFLTNQRLMRIDWTGTAFKKVWEVPYDFTGGSTTGSGTTPTLLGTPEDPDQLVVMVDNHAPSNRLVAMWRETIPADWPGLPGQDRRIAAITELPLAVTDGTTQGVENSPCGWGYELAVAQYNGFRPPADPIPGVQKLRWDPIADTMSVVWANAEVSCNNVLTYSAGSELVYGSGRRGGVYHFWGLDWDTGTVRIEQPLGEGDIFLDQGNQVVLLPDRSAVFGTLRGMVRIRPMDQRRIRIDAPDREAPQLPHLLDAPWHFPRLDGPGWSWPNLDRRRDQMLGWDPAAVACK